MKAMWKYRTSIWALAGMTLWLSGCPMPDNDDNQQSQQNQTDPAKCALYTDGDGDGFGSEKPEDCSGTVAKAGDCNDSDAAINPAALDLCGDEIDNDCDGRVDLGTLTRWPDLGSLGDQFDADEAVTFSVGTAEATFTRSGGTSAPYIPPASSTAPFEPTGDVELAWQSVSPYFDVHAPTSGTVTFDLPGSAEQAIGPGWRWIVGVGGTSGEGGPTKITPSIELTYIGKQNAFNTNVFPTIQDDGTIVGSYTGAPDGILYFFVPEDATQVSFEIEDPTNSDLHGYMLGAVMLDRCACDTTGDVGLATYADADGDGFGAVGGEATYQCDSDVPEGRATKAGDCDDDAAEVNPDADEVCDETDNNCDGTVDEGFESTPDGNPRYIDRDGDGFGDEQVGPECMVPGDYVTAGGDCNDDDADISPSAVEICADGVDNNCDGRVDEANGDVVWNDLSQIAYTPAGTEIDLPVGDNTVRFSRTGTGGVAPYTPPSTTDGSFTMPDGTVVEWTGDQPYLDILTDVNGVLTYDLGGSAGDLYAPGWRWVVGIAGTGGGGGPVTTTSSVALEFVGNQDAFGTGRYATIVDEYTIQGSTDTTDGYSFFLLPQDTSLLELTVQDPATNDQHGVIIGAIATGVCEAGGSN